MDIRQQPVRGIPTVELHVNRSVGGEEWLESFQHGTGEGILAAKSEALFGSTVTVEPARGAGTQIQAQIERGRPVADTGGVFHIAEGFVVTGGGRRRFVLIVEPIPRFEGMRLVG